MLLAIVLAMLFGGPPDDVSGEACGGLELVASMTHNPSTWADAVVDIPQPATFEIPASLSVTQGNAGNHQATVSFSNGGGALVECTYIGGSSQANPVGQTEIDLGLWYHLDHCDDGSVAGELATADHVEAHVANGDSTLASTEISVLLTDASCILDDGPCAGGTWGDITWLGQTVHVRSDGDDLDDGSLGSPVATMDRALDLARAMVGGGKKAIAVGPGQFDAALRLDDAVTDDDLWVMGCSPAETVLLGSDPAAPVLDLASAASMGIKGLTLQGGGGGAEIRDGADGWMVNVAAVNNGGPGVRVQDASTLATLIDLEVTDPTAVGCGWGVGVQDGTVFMRGGSVTGAHEVGVGILDSADALLLDTVISSTAQDGAGYLGRGVHAQDAFMVVVQAHLIDNFDAGIFLKDPHGAVISNILIEFTSAGITANGGSTGDGIVVVGGAGASVMIIDNIIYEADRSAVVVEDGDAWIASNTTASGGVKQGVTSITGPQGGALVDMTAAPLDLNKNSQACN